MLGIIGIIMGAYGFMNSGASLAGVSMNMVTAIVPFIVGLIFFIAGYGLVKNTGDRS